LTVKQLLKDLETVRRALHLSPEQLEQKQREKEFCKLLGEYDVCLKAVVIYKKYGENAYKLATDEEKQILIDSARLYIKARDKLYPEDPKLHQYKSAIESACQRNIDALIAQYDLKVKE